MVALRFASSLRAFRALRRHQVNVFSLRDDAEEHAVLSGPQQALQQTEWPASRAPPAAPPRQEVLLEEIRNLLAKQS